MKKIVGITTALLLFIGASSFTLISNGADSIQENTDKMTPIHRIQLGSYSDGVPIDVVQLLMQVGDVLTIKTDESVTYYTPPFHSFQESAAAVPKYVNVGFTEAEQAIEYDGKFYSVDEYKVMIKERKEKYPIRVIEK
jgi:hypothetical protein